MFQTNLHCLLWKSVKQITSHLNFSINYKSNLTIGDILVSFVVTNNMLTSFFQTAWWPWTFLDFIQKRSECKCTVMALFYAVFVASDWAWLGLEHNRNSHASVFLDSSLFSPNIPLHLNLTEYFQHQLSKADFCLLWRQVQSWNFISS